MSIIAICIYGKMVENGNCRYVHDMCPWQKMNSFHKWTFVNIVIMGFIKERAFQLFKQLNLMWNLWKFTWLSTTIEWINLFICFMLYAVLTSISLIRWLAASICWGRKQNRTPMQQMPHPYIAGRPSHVYRILHSKQWTICYVYLQECVK